MIPIWLIPWKAKAEIERLSTSYAQTAELRHEISECREQLGIVHAEAARLTRERDAERDKLANVAKWITLTHALSGLRVAEGRTVDILKRPKIENKNDLHIVLPPVG